MLKAFLVLFALLIVILTNPKLFEFVIGLLEFLTKRNFESDIWNNVRNILNYKKIELGDGNFFLDFGPSESIYWFLICP